MQIAASEILNVAYKAPT